MKKIITAGALGVGIGIGGGIASDAGEERASTADQHQDHSHHPNLVLLFADDYRSDALFRPIDRLPQRTVNTILGSRMDGGPVVSEPTDYNGYVVLVKSHPNATGKYTFVFVNEETLQQEQWYRLTDDAVFFDADANLLSAVITTDTGVRETPTTEAMATTEETTTHAVVVNATETDDTTTEANDSP